MTETIEGAVFTEAVAIIDRALGGLASRELVSSNEVADLLLDLRTLLAAHVPPVGVSEPTGVSA